MTTKEPNVMKQDAVNFEAVAKEILSMPHIKKDRYVAAEACLIASRELIVAIDAYGKLCNQLQQGLASLEMMEEGAKFAKNYQTKRDVFLAAKAKFLE